MKFFFNFSISFVNYCGFIDPSHKFAYSKEICQIVSLDPWRVWNIAFFHVIITRSTSMLKFKKKKQDVMNMSSEETKAIVE